MVESWQKCIAYKAGHNVNGTIFELFKQRASGGGERERELVSEIGRGKLCIKHMKRNGIRAQKSAGK